MSKFARFNRHESMNSETLSEIMNIKRELYGKDVNGSIENMLSGLFDGYLYENLIIEAEKLPLDLFKRIQKIYLECKNYKQLNQ